MRMRRTHASTTAVAAAAMLLTACSTMGEDATERDGEGSNGSSDQPGTVVLATHGSFHLPKKLISEFEAESGYELQVKGAGDAGTLATKLSLTADNPIADAAFGIDNTFASRPLEAGAFAEFTPELPAGADAFALAEGADRLTPIDNGNVCVNVDTAWFDQEGIEAPTTLDDLAKPAYRGLFVTPGASTSSPGMAFFLATVAEYGEAWPTYWQDLMANDTKIVDGWEDAYYGDFTAAADKGTRPIVVSYDSSPAFTLKGGETTTAALLDTCFQQVEYAGVLEGADNPEGAELLIQWLLGDDVQSALPKAMYVFPVSESAQVPDDWAAFAPRPELPHEVDPAEIQANRESWLTDWTDIISR